MLAGTLFRVLMSCLDPGNGNVLDAGTGNPIVLAANNTVKVTTRGRPVVTEILQSVYWPLHARPLDWFAAGNDISGSGRGGSTDAVRVAELLETLVFVPPQQRRETQGGGSTTDASTGGGGGSSGGPTGNGTASGAAS